MLCNRSPGFFVANSRTSLVFSGGTCLRMICPDGIIHISIGIFAPVAILKRVKSKSSQNLHTYLNTEEVRELKWAIENSLEILGNCGFSALTQGKLFISSRTAS